MRGKLILALALSFLFQFSVSPQVPLAEKPSSESSEKIIKKANERPQGNLLKEKFDDASLAALAQQCVQLKTEKGDILIELFPESAPQTVRNFLNLTAIGVFDTTTFSRVVPGFIIQGGSISSRETRTQELTDRARRKIPDEPSLIKHERGIVSMARGDEPGSASSNFFILLDAAAHLDGTFAAFGRVIQGIEVAELINNMTVEGEKPVKPVRIETAAVIPCNAR